MEDKHIAIDLLKFNYQNLHEGVWNNHKVAWTVTSIFVPVLFAMLGYLAREYFVLSRLQTAIGFSVTESLLIIWLLIMRTFEHYNRIRFGRLKEIENRFNKMIEDIDFSQYNLDYAEKSRRLRFSPMRIYYTFFSIYTSLNIVLLGSKFLPT